MGAARQAIYWSLTARAAETLRHGLRHTAKRASYGRARTLRRRHKQNGLGRSSWALVIRRLPSLQKAVGAFIRQAPRQDRMLKSLFNSSRKENGGLGDCPRCRHQSVISCSGSSPTRAPRRISWWQTTVASLNGRRSRGIRIEDLRKDQSVGEQVFFLEVCCRSTPAYVFSIRENRGSGLSADVYLSALTRATGCCSDATGGSQA